MSLEVKTRTRRMRRLNSPSLQSVATLTQLLNHRLGQIPRKPTILNFCRQTRGKVGKQTFLDENYALNTKKLFTRSDFEFLTMKLQL